MGRTWPNTACSRPLLHLPQSRFSFTFRAVYRLSGALPMPPWSPATPSAVPTQVPAQLPPARPPHANPASSYSDKVSPEDHGFSIHSQLVSVGECNRLIADLSAPSLPRTRAGVRHLMSHPAIRTLAHDPRLIQIARRALGKAAVPFRATLFDKSPASNWLIPWHQDTALPLTSRFDAPGWGPWSRKADVCYTHAPAWALARVIALRLHLDESAADNGPLRVIPDSHTSGILTDARIAEIVRSAEAVACLVQLGGILAMRPLLVHSSSKALTDAPRRVVHIEYAEALDLSPGIRLAIA